MSQTLGLQNLSVLVTCYNKIDYVVPCFTYLKELSKLGAEIVIVDDGSNDGSSELIVQQMHAMHLQPTLKTTSNNGLAAARDLAITLATKEFIYCLDIDDTPNTDSILEIVTKLEKGVASVGVGNFWYMEQNQPGTPVVKTNEYIVVNSSSIRDSIFDARGWWRYIYRRDFLMLPGNRFGRVFENLKKESFVLDDIYWMAHLAAQNFDLLVAPETTYVTNYLLPTHNAGVRWEKFLKQVALIPQASLAYVKSVDSHHCNHNSQWMFKRLFNNLWDHMTLLPLAQQVQLMPVALLSSWKIATKVSLLFRFKLITQVLLVPIRRVKRKLFELKTH